MMKKNIRVLFLFLGVGFLVYFNSLKNPFQYDDFHLIPNNTYIQNIGSFFFDYFTDGRTSSALPENSGYRPLTTLGYAICWWIGSGNVVVFHLYKILFHVLVAYLIFLISSLLLKKESLELQLEFAYWKNKKVTFDSSSIVDFIAFLPGFFFIIHPAFTEAVNYMSATSSIQASFFYLTAFYCFLKSLDAPSSSAKKYIAGMVIAFFASFLSKEEGATFPAIATLFLVFYSDIERKSAGGNGYSGSAWNPEVKSAKLGQKLQGFFNGCVEVIKKYKLQVLCMWIAFITCVTLYFFMAPESGKLSRFGVSPSYYLTTQLYAWVYYLFWLVTPWGYAIEHMEFGFNQNLFEFRTFFAIFVIAALLFSVLKYRKIYPLLCFSVLWYFVTILPSSSIFPLTEPINEHRYYLSYTLLFAGLGYGFVLLAQKLQGLKIPEAKKQYLVSGFLFFSFVFLACSTLRQNYIWSSGELVWQNVVERDETNARAHNNLGTVYLSRNENEKALGEFLKCSQYWNAYKYCYINQHVTYMKLGKVEESRKAIQKVIDLDPNFMIGYEYLARFELIFENKPQQALETLKRCNSLSTEKYKPCVSMTMDAYRRVGDRANMINFSRKLISLDPGNRDSAFSTGLLLVEAREFDEAYNVFNMLFEKNPKDIQAVYNMAWVQMQKNNWQLSAKHWEDVLKLNPQENAAIQNLAFVKARIERRVPSSK